MERPIDIAPLVYARIVVGILIGLEFSGGLFTKYAQTLINTNFHFSYELTPFIEPWANKGIMYGQFILNFVLGLLFASGLFFRWVTALFLLSGASLFLMEKSLYINHFYLYSLILLLFLFLPANRAFSLDTWRKPELKVSEIPAWCIYILLFQISVVYVYAGFAKLNTDWLQAQPLQIWLAKKADFTIIGAFISTKFHAYVVAYGGILFDLFIAPLMLFKRSRKIAFAICCFFHISNVITFGVGTFPWFSIAITALFFPAANFRRWRLKDKILPLGTKVFQYGKAKKWVYAFLSLYISLQLLLPMRQYLYPGNPSWTEEGHFFAWRMMLRTKQSSITFRVADTKSDKKERVNLSDHLNNRQISRMSGNPDMILQFAHYLDHYYSDQKGYEAPKVTARNKVSLNGRKAQKMIRSGIDLAKEKRGLHHYDWILPLKDEDDQLQPID